MSVNPRNIGYFEKLGDFEEKVECQGKGAKIIWNELNDALLNSWGHNIA